MAIQSYHKFNLNSLGPMKASILGGTSIVCNPFCKILKILKSNQCKVIPPQFQEVLEPRGSPIKIQLVTLYFGPAFQLPQKRSSLALLRACREFHFALMSKLRYF